MAEEISDGKIREALKLLETEHKELELRKVGLVSYLNTKQANRELEKQKAALQGELASLKAMIKSDFEEHAKNKEAMQTGMANLKAEQDKAHEAQRDAEMKELAGLKASIAKAKKQAADAEKEANQKIDAAKNNAAEVLNANEKLMEDLDREIQRKRDRIAALDEEFRSIAAKHGLGAAA